jgi:hypothetical protein
LIRAQPLELSKKSHFLLDQLFYANVGSWCTLFGIAPTAYISGITKRAYCQDKPYNATDLPVTNRMVWGLATATDQMFDSAAAKRYCAPEDLATLLYEVYGRMFPFEDRTHVIPEEGTPLQPIQKGPYYTRASFAMSSISETSCHLGVEGDDAASFGIHYVGSEFQVGDHKL